MGGRLSMASWLVSIPVVYREAILLMFVAFLLDSSELIARDTTGLCTTTRTTAQDRRLGHLKLRFMATQEGEKGHGGLILDKNR